MLRKLFAFAIVMLVSIVTCYMFCAKNEFRFSCKEFPFSSIKLPLREVHSSLQMALSDNTGRHVILIRIIDASNDEFIFAILNDGKDGGYKTILKNLPITWRNAGSFADTLQDADQALPLPLALFENSKSYDRIEDTKNAMRDLKQLLKFHKDTNGNWPAYERLRK